VDGFDGRKDIRSGGNDKRPGDAHTPRGRHQEASPDAIPTVLTAAEAARLWRDAMKDKSYRAFPLGLEAGHYLRAKRKRLTKESYRDYEACLDKLARYYADLELADLEPPVGTERVEEFLEFQWGARAGRTYNKNLSILRDFFKFQVLRGKLHGDPTLAIERARKRDVYRRTFSSDQVRAIVASQAELRDRVAVRLLLDYGLRKGALKAIQFKHFDHQRKRLTVFTKGEKVRELPIPHPPFWFDLERLIIEVAAQPSHYLMQRQVTHPVRFENGKAVEFRMHRLPDKPMGDHGLHDWWCRCLERAGIVDPGTTSGDRMHKARHTAGQRVLDATGNLKATQKLLGHASIQTTGDVYANWDIDQLAETMRAILEAE
jgi:site-specific recombinase XerC